MFSNYHQTMPLVLKAGGEVMEIGPMSVSLSITCSTVASNKGRVHCVVSVIAGLHDGTETLDQVTESQSTGWMTPYHSIALANELIAARLDWIADMDSDQFRDYVLERIGQPETKVRVNGRVIG